MSWRIRTKYGGWLRYAGTGHILEYYTKDEAEKVLAYVNNDYALGCIGVESVSETENYGTSQEKSSANR